MAVDTFLKLDGIKGESRDDKHPDEIEVLSWSWGLAQTGSFHSGGGGGTGKVDISDINFMKTMDLSTAKLMLACANGQHIKEANLVARKAGEKPLEYLKIKLTGVLISNVQESHSDGGGLPTDSFSLNFKQVDLKYYTQDASGKEGLSEHFGWDVSAHKES